MPNIQYFTPDATTPSTGTSAGTTAAASALPTRADALLYIFNLGSWPVFFKLGTSSGNATTGLTPSTGCPVLPGQGLIVGVGANTYIGLVISGGMGGTTTVNLTSGN
jgi:hypothetical protein